MPDDQTPSTDSEPMPKGGMAAIAWAILRTGREVAGALDRLAEALHRLADAHM